MLQQLLRPGQRVATDTGLECTVEGLLGAGGQGEVYRAGFAGRPHALKWYFPKQATRDQRRILKDLVRRGAPSARFLWPLAVAEAPGIDTFGYVMPLREAHYRGIVDLMKARIEPTFRAIGTAALQLVDAYYSLHSRGLCYRDINFQNVFFDPATGDVLICDNDNVTVDGAAYSGVLGTPRFMAPEIVIGQARPSRATDLHSLAVLLCYLFLVNHPLEGARESRIRCMDLPAMNRLYGEQPLFIFDPDDADNAPDPAVHRNALVYWALYPGFLRDLFTQAFTVGLADPDARVQESVWRQALCQLRDGIFYCAACGAESFYDHAALAASGGRLPACWSCHAALRLPPRIRIGSRLVMLNHDSRLFQHHLEGDYDFETEVAAVTRNPADPRIWGLENRTASRWRVTPATGEVMQVDPGRSLRLQSGVRVDFGRVEGQLRA